MSNKRLSPRSPGQRGFSLIELVLAIVILGVGIAGVMSVFATVVSHSADPLVHKQMLSIAEQMMEEIRLQPFEAAAPAQVNAAGTCPSRTAFNDIMDYNNLQTAGGICDPTGTALPQLSGYDMSVSIDSAASLGTLGGGKVYKITVTVTHGSDSLKLVGFRTDYAAGLG